MRREFLVVATIVLFVLLVKLCAGSRVMISPLIVKAPNFLKPVVAEEARIYLGGDVMLGRSVMTKSLKENDDLYPFRNIKTLLGKADLVFVNLEAPIIKNCPETNSGLVFCTRPQLLEGLKFKGTTVVSLANNHTRNYGLSGLEETKKYLRENNIEYVDGEDVVIRNVRGTKIGFVGFNLLDSKLSEEGLNIVRDVKARSDILIAGVHWGAEYRRTPNDLQKKYADQLLNSGVDVIAGHHSHWIGDIGEGNGKYIFYSLGNLVFDQMWSEETRKGILVRMIVGDRKIKSYKVVHTYIAQIGQPVLVDEGW